MDLDLDLFSFNFPPDTADEREITNKDKQRKIIGVFSFPFSIHVNLVDVDILVDVDFDVILMNNIIVKFNKN